MNQKLEAALAVLDKLTAELKQSNAQYKATNDRFAAYVARWDREGKAPPEWRMSTAEFFAVKPGIT